MDFVKIWGSLLAASANAGNAQQTSIPTTFFMQGVQVFACPSDANSCISSAPSITSLSSDESNSERLQADKEDANNCNEDAVLETTGKATSRRRIQRIRYSREEYKCPTCPYTCTIEKAFLRHVRTCDCSPSSRLSCPICGKDRDGEQMILAHMLKHREGKHFCCDLCKFRTLQLKKLIQHRRMHTGEKPHLCPFCVYRSARRDNLRSHVRRVHKKDNLTCDTFTPRSMILTPSREKRK